MVLDGFCFYYLEGESTMIRISYLKKSYGENLVLKDINMNLAKGEIYGLIGHNGAGKTSLMNILTGITKKDSGVIEFESSSIGYVPENPVFYEHLTLFEYYNFIGGLKGIKDNWDDNFNLIGLSKHKNRKIKDFSRGMKQRAAIGVSLIGNPDILIWDEPTSALDPTGRIEIQNLLLELKKKEKTILLSTHILNDVENICDRVGLIKDGKMIYESNGKELFKTSGKIRFYISQFSKKNWDYFNNNEIEIVENGIIIDKDNIEIRKKILEVIVKDNLILDEMKMDNKNLEQLYMEVMKNE
jgi:ABC-2 type transport system ATP-binding protein